MFVSTRGASEQVSAAEAIIKGLAVDGGLFVPQHIPAIKPERIADLAQYDYRQRALAILELLLQNYTQDELYTCIANAYNTEKFESTAIAPVVQIDSSKFILELWHGPTCAFKDMALQLLPQLLSTALKKTGETDEIVILVATSGDTGKAALEGFKDVDQIRILVFYPNQGVSEIQRLQMITQKGDNVAVMAVNGNFDDAQTGVKNIFNDAKFNIELNNSGFRLSSANSINWGRLVPQIVYYFSAYADLVREGKLEAGAPVNFIVPTGNFGNILAGYYAKIMGLPIHRLICASNSNNVLTEFLQTGNYNRQRTFYKTISPSMDILISSNLERLLYHVTDGDTKQVNNWMKELNDTGNYNVGANYLDKIQQIFWAGWIDDNETSTTIKNVYKQHNYVVDPHTAVAWRVSEMYRRQTGDTLPCIILSTASPFKFNQSVLSAIEDDQNVTGMSEFDMLKMVAEISGYTIPAVLANLENDAVIHTQVCEKSQLTQAVRCILGKKE